MIKTLIKQINEALKNILADANKRYRLGRISDTLLNCSKEFILRPGKRIRPLLFVLSYYGFSPGQTADKKLFTSAASLELLHDYMLIHDDVIDNSDWRRGKPTVHRLFEKKIKLADKARIGPQLAIVAGDIIFALGIEAFLAVDEEPRRKELALKKLVETAAYTGAGEFIDIVFGHQSIRTFSEQKIFLSYTLKTAKYTFECPLLMGGILAGVKQDRLKLLSKLGIAAGQAFQIYDDFLDLFSTREVIGKPILTDLAESKKTLFVWTAYKNLRGKQRLRFQEIFEKRRKTAGDLDEFRRLIIESGSDTYGLNKIKSLQNKALRLAGGLKMKTPYKKILQDLIINLSAPPAR